MLSSAERFVSLILINSHKSTNQSLTFLARTGGCLTHG